MVTGDGDDAVFVEEEEGSASGPLGSAGRLAEYLRWSHGGQGDSAMAGGEEKRAADRTPGMLAGGNQARAGVEVERDRSG